MGICVSKQNNPKDQQKESQQDKPYKQRKIEKLKFDEQLNYLVSDNFNKEIRLTKEKEDLIGETLIEMNFTQNTELLEGLDFITQKIANKDELIIGFSGSSVTSKEIISKYNENLQTPYQNLLASKTELENKPSISNALLSLLQASVNTYQVVLAVLDFNLIDQEKWWGQQGESEYLSQIYKETKEIIEQQCQGLGRGTAAPPTSSNSTANNQKISEEFLNQIYDDVAKTNKPSQ